MAEGAARFHVSQKQPVHNRRHVQDVLQWSTNLVQLVDQLAHTRPYVDDAPVRCNVNIITAMVP